MRSTILCLLLTLSLFLLLLTSGCVDALVPAGPAQYENPDYPSEYVGYALIPAQFTDGFCYQGQVYLLDKTGHMLISFSVSDPNLAIPEKPAEMDTLMLGFPPGKSCFDEFTETLFISNSVSNDIYRIPLSGGGSPQLIHQSSSQITSIFSVDNGNSLLICFLGPEWLVRKINATTGAVEGEYTTEWPIGRAALSVDGSRLLINNSAKYVIVEIDVSSLTKTDSIPLPERSGPFLYNTSGNIVVFNQYTINPRVYLFDGETKSKLDVIESINPYKFCFLMPGTDVVLAPRRSDDRVSVLNSDNMIFAPSLFCFNYAEMVFSSPDNSYIIVLSDNPARAFVYENSI